MNGYRHPVAALVLVDVERNIDEALYIYAYEYAVRASRVSGPSAMLDILFVFSSPILTLLKH